MKITIENEEYDLNIDRAVELGIAKKVRPKLTSIKPGDVFKVNPKGNNYIVIIKTHDDKYLLGGLLNNPFDLYSQSEMSEAEALAFLNGNNWGYIDNISKGWGHINK